MIVNNSCNNLTLNNVDFWGDSASINTNVKLCQCADDAPRDVPPNAPHDISHEFKKRLKIKSNRFKRLYYNNEETKEIKKNYRYDR
jgi:hypothetical protein|uniref:Uncharacterized protein n=1 Tax=viral metagenome TaxID=1070528 RepID=A0A6C0IXH8_9ZZZZ